MEVFKEPNILLFILIILYFVPLIVGYFLKKGYEIKISNTKIIDQKLADPLTVKASQKLKEYKSNLFKKSRPVILFFITFLNNFVLTALITRIIYGVVFFIPLFWTIWTGFSQGVFFSKLEKKILPVLFFEAVGYLMASVVGITLGIEIFDFLMEGSDFVWSIPWNYLKYSIIFIAVAALIETFIKK